MIKYAKIVDERTKKCDVGLGTNNAYYESIGFIELDVEHCEWDNCWYLTGYVPEEPEEVIKSKKIAELKKELSEIDNKSSRSMRAILSGLDTQDDRQYLLQLESRAEELRNEIRELEQTPY